MRNQSWRITGAWESAWSRVVVRLLRVHEGGQQEDEIGRVELASEWFFELVPVAQQAGLPRGFAQARVLGCRVQMPPQCPGKHCGTIDRIGAAGPSARRLSRSSRDPRVWPFLLHARPPERAGTAFRRMMDRSQRTRSFACRVPRCPRADHARALARCRYFSFLRTTVRVLYLFSILPALN